MKTTEELRKELEQLKREEYDACLDFSHKIKPLEEQLNAAEKGDLLFGDVQLQSKLAYVNDLLSNSGLPLLLARKSELLDFSSKEQADTFYKQLALFYRRRQDKELQLLYTFDNAATVSDLFEQISLVENQLDFLKFLCSLTLGKDIPPYFQGKLGDGEVSLYYFDELGGFPIEGSNLFIMFDSLTNRYSLRFERVVKCFCADDSNHYFADSVSSKIDVRFVGNVNLTMAVRKDNIRSSDLSVALDELIARLLELHEGDKVTAKLTLVTK